MLRSSKKIGRNDPCPCGSGKKYKKCHGMDNNNAKALGPQPKPSSIPASATDVHMDPMGLPGQHQHVISIISFKILKTPEISAAPGDYRGSTR